MKNEMHHIAATLAWVFVGIAALILVAPHGTQHVAAVTGDEALAHEVAVQCADEVNGTLDALAEGMDDPSLVPAPYWEETVAMCDIEFDGGANYAEAPELVLAKLGA